MSRIHINAKNWLLQQSLMLSNHIFTEIAMAWVDKYAGLQDGYDSYLLCLFTQSVLEPPI